MSAIISFINSRCNCNSDFFCLVRVVSVAGFGVGSLAASGVGSAAGFDVGCGVVILSKFFIGNNLFLKLFGTFPLALNNNPKLFKKYFFQAFFYLSQIKLTEKVAKLNLAKLLCLRSAFSNEKYPSRISLKKQ